MTFIDRLSSSLLASKIWRLRLTFQSGWRISAQVRSRPRRDSCIVLIRGWTASWIDKHLTDWIQPQMLRAPEVILGAKWDSKVDIWNVGLVVNHALHRRRVLS